ncbi:MAG: acyl carrier protein [Solirubrobacteraceae bacterium]
MVDEKVLAGVRDVVGQYAGISLDAATIDPQADLYAAGMTSFASVEVMLGLEEEFGITFPQELIGRATFLSIAAMAEAVSTISSQS